MFWRAIYKGITAKNIGAIKKRMNLKVRMTPNFGQMVVYKKNELLRTLIFGRMVMHKERTNKRKKVIYFCRMVKCK